MVTLRATLAVLSRIKLHGVQHTEASNCTRVGGEGAKLVS